MSEQPGVPAYGAGPAHPDSSESAPPMSERMQALLSRAVEDQLTEQRQLASLVAEVRALLAALPEEVAAAAPIDEALRAEVQRVRVGLTAIEQRVDVLTAAAQKPSDVGDRIAALDAKLTSLESRIGQLDGKLSGLGDQLGGVVTALADSEGRVKSHVDEAVLALAEVMLRRSRSVAAARPVAPPAPQPAQPVVVPAVAPVAEPKREPEPAPAAPVAEDPTPPDVAVDETPPAADVSPADAAPVEAAWGAPAAPAVGEPAVDAADDDDDEDAEPDAEAAATDDLEADLEDDDEDDEDDEDEDDDDEDDDDDDEEPESEAAAAVPPAVVPPLDPWAVTSPFQPGPRRERSDSGAAAAIAELHAGDAEGPDDDEAPQERQRRKPWWRPGD